MNRPLQSDSGALLWESHLSTETPSPRDPGPADKPLGAVSHPVLAHVAERTELWGCPSAPPVLSTLLHTFLPKSSFFLLFPSLVFFPMRGTLTGRISKEVKPGSLSLKRTEQRDHLGFKS